MGIHLNTPPYFWEDRGITADQKREAFEATVANVVMFDHFGSVDPDNLLAKTRYMIKSCGCDYIFLDHLSIVVSGLGDGDERRLIDNAMTSLRSLVEETQAAMFVVSHLRRPDGDRGHEEGGPLGVTDQHEVLGGEAQLLRHHITVLDVLGYLNGLAVELA